jgi:hypothetical protein
MDGYLQNKKAISMEEKDSENTLLFFRTIKKRRHQTLPGTSQ